MMHRNTIIVFVLQIRSVIHLATSAGAEAACRYLAQGQPRHQGAKCAAAATQRLRRRGRCRSGDFGKVHRAKSNVALRKVT